MFFLNNIPLIGKETIYYFKSNLILFIISIIGSTPLLKITINKIRESKLKIIIDVLEPVTYIILLYCSLASFITSVIKSDFSFV